MGDSHLLLVMRYSWNLVEVKKVAFIDTEGLGMHETNSITRRDRMQKSQAYHH